jgi:uncharacterized protein with PIN domain
MHKMNTEEQTCSSCNGSINFYSEGETYDYSQDMQGNILYLCEDCLNKEIEQQVSGLRKCA